MRIGVVAEDGDFYEYRGVHTIIDYENTLYCYPALQDHIVMIEPDEHTKHILKHELVISPADNHIDKMFVLAEVQHERR